MQGKMVSEGNSKALMYSTESFAKCFHRQHPHGASPPPGEECRPGSHRAGSLRLVLQNQRGRPFSMAHSAMQWQNPLPGPPFLQPPAGESRT